MLVWALLVAVGLNAVIASYPPLLSVMKLVGGAYLLWLAYRGARGAFAGGSATIRSDGARRSAFGSWRRGLLVVLTNPKAFLMWSAVGTFLFGSGLSVVEVIAFGPVAAVSASLIYGAYAFAFSTGIAARAYAATARVFDGAMGAAFGILGGRLLIDGVRELRA